MLGQGSTASLMAIKGDHLALGASTVFRLNTLVGGFLLICAGLVFVKELSGSHIKCIQTGTPTVDEGAFDSYCYISSTFTLPATNRMMPTVHPAVGPIGTNQLNEMLYHNYYQWIPYLLLLQSASFFAPLAFFRWQEDGCLESMLEDLDVAPKDVDLIFRDRSSMQTWWAAKLLLCHVWSLVTTVANVFFVQWYLGGQFLWYGVTAMSYLAQRDGQSPFDLVFPKVTKCTLNKYGPSGSVQNHDALCVLPVNVLNDKIYLAAWFVLLGVSVLSLAFHVAAAVVLSSGRLRTQLLLQYVSPWQKQQRRLLSGFVAAAGLADWLLIIVLARNLGRMAFSRLVESICIQDEDSCAERLAESDKLLTNQIIGKEKMSHLPV